MAKKKKSPIENEKRQALRFFRGNSFGKANALYTQIYKKNPKDFDACFMLGIIASKTGNRVQAIRLLSHATRIKKNVAKAHYQLGLVYRDSGEHESAISALSTAVRIKPDYGEAYDALTMVLQMAARHRDLIDTCREAILVIPNAVEIHARLVGALEFSNQVDAACEAADAALRLQPKHPRVHLTLAKIERRRGEVEAARDRLCALLDSRLTPVQYSAVAGELGEVFDRLGDFDRAFQSFQSANQALLRTTRPDLITQNTIIDRVARCRSFFSAEVVADWAGDEPDDGLESPLFIVGFPRSGTTLTEQVLTASGAIQPSDEQPILVRLLREMPGLLGRPFHYPEDLRNLSLKEIESLRARYFVLVEDMVGGIAPGKRFLDKLPLNIIDLGMIYRIFPAARVIVVLRDPRDCCLSCFTHQFVPNEAMVNFTDLSRTGTFYAAVMGLWQHYRAVLPLDCIESRYEDLVDDMEGTARTLLDFAGVEWDDEVLKFFEKVGERDVRTPSYAAIASPVYRRAMGRWKNYREQLAPMMDCLAPFVAKFGYDT